MRSPETRRIATYLGRQDPVLRGLLLATGAPDYPPRPGGFSALARAILYQQISGRAGDAIVRRLRSAHGRPGFPSAPWFLEASSATLRSAGVSPQKSRYLKDLAEHVVDGRLDLRRLPRRTDQEVIDELTAVHGVGVWTAQMYLIFSLGRPDVLPLGDLGIRKAVGRSWGFQRLPAEGTVERLGRKWAPFRTYAARTLWSSLALPSNAPPRVPRPANPRS